MKNGSTYFKYSVILIIAVFIFIFFRRCGHSGSGKATQDTIRITIDTTIEIVRIDTHYMPKPYKVNVPVPYIVHDSLIEYSVEKVDSLAILKDYLSKKFYRDSIPNKYGYFIFEDTLHKNEIIGRGIVENLSIPTITKTFTIEARPKAMLMVGGEVLGNQNNILYATGVSLGLKARNSKYYAVKGFLDKHGTVYYGFQFTVPIRLRK